MPLKKGAGGCLRHYSRVTGRYVTEFPAISRPDPDAKTRINQKIQAQDMDNRAHNSKDPLLPEVYEALQKYCPNSVLHVNWTVRSRSNLPILEIDIETKKQVIEIKSGSARRCLTQFLNQQIYAAEHNRIAIVYAPNIKPGTEKEYQRRGILIVKTIQEIIEKERKK